MSCRLDSDQCPANINGHLSLVKEAEITQIVRKLLQLLKKNVLENTSLKVSVDYDDTSVDGLNLVAMAKLPALVLSGPRLRANRFYLINPPHQDVIHGEDVDQLVHRYPPYTVDLLFTITAASNRSVELLNLMAAVATFLNRHRWIELYREPDEPNVGSVRWEMEPEGDFRTQLHGPDDVRAFSCGLVIRGFDIDEGYPPNLIVV